MPAVNALLQDATVSHLVDLQLYGNGVVRRIIALLNRVDTDLAAQLTQAIESLTASDFSVERLESLLGSVRQLNAQAYQAVGLELTAELKRLAEYEAGYQFWLFSGTIPAQIVTEIGVAAVNVEQVYAAAMARPFQGRLLREWASGIEANRMARVRDAVRMGFVEQQTTEQIVRRVRGTKANGYSDGIIEIDRRDAEAVVRTALSHTAGVTRDRFHEANADLVKAIQWVSTLDARTSSPCRLRDGLLYSTGTHKPQGHQVPWLAGPGRLHWRCRSCSAPVLKSWKELGINLPAEDKSTRASMDGQVPEDVTFAAWIKRQSAARQDEILGAARGKMLRGGLELKDFYTIKGRELSLTELRQREGL